jgi:hypothetical protein
VSSDPFRALTNPLPGRYRVRPSQREGELIIPSLWEGRPLRAGEGNVNCLFST